MDDLSGPVDGYIRVSRVGDRGGESYISPDIQRRAIESWASERGVALVMHEPEENVSGGTMDRPVFNEITRRIRMGQSGGIVVYKLDRFARTMVGGLTALHELAERGALFASATEARFDFTTADGRMFMQMNLMLAEYFRERTKESWATSLAHAVERGVHIAPTVPYGYVKDLNKRLVPDEAAPFVREAFEKRVAGWPWQRIASWLNGAAPRRSDGRDWVASTVERMVHRRVYMGLAHWGEEQNADAHDALVDRALWEAAQRKAQGHSRSVQGDEQALLHGIARCAGCRFQMSRALNTGSTGSRRRYYRCRVHRVSGVCAAPAAIRGDGDDGLEAYVEGVVIAELERLQRTFTEVTDTEELAAALAELDSAQRDLDEMRNDTTARRRLAERWLDFVEPYVVAVEQAQARVDALREAHDGPKTVLTVDAYLAMSRQERAEALRGMIDCIFVRNVGGRGRGVGPIGPARVRILWRGSGPSDLPASNRVSSMVPWPWPSE